MIGAVLVVAGLLFAIAAGFGAKVLGLASLELLAIGVVLVAVGVLVGVVPIRKV
jgi:MFS-type transporter involved in bile tolerance (Atg22 family)